jgi:hypothetical protein
MPGKPSASHLKFDTNDWVQVDLAQTGGFAGLNRSKQIHRAALSPALLDSVNSALHHLWNLKSNEALAPKTDPCTNYPDRQHFTVNVTCKNTGCWQLTFDSSALPLPALELAEAFPLEPSTPTNIT